MSISDLYVQTDSVYPKYVQFGKLPEKHVPRMFITVLHSIDDIDCYNGILRTLFRKAYRCKSEH